MTCLEFGVHGITKLFIINALDTCKTFICNPSCRCYLNVFTWLLIRLVELVYLHCWQDLWRINIYCLQIFKPVIPDFFWPLRAVKHNTETFPPLRLVGKQAGKSCLFTVHVLQIWSNISIYFESCLCPRDKCTVFWGFVTVSDLYRISHKVCLRQEVRAHC